MYDPNDSPDILSKTVDVCGHCAKKCGGEGPLNEAIQCDLCSTWVHASCEGISSDDYKLLTNLTSATDNVIYYCSLNQCLTRVKQIVFMHFTKPSDSTENVQPSLLSEHQSLQNSVSTLSEKINSLCTNNNQLQNQLNSTISSLGEQAHTVSHASSFNAVDEYMDRERRKLNLIVYGIPEASAPTGSERQTADLKSIQGLVHSEFKITNLETTKCYRLGKQSNKQRPLLIKLSDSSTRRQILRNAKTLRNSSTYKNVFISPDLTPQERASNKQLRIELQRRKAAGEPNLIIKRGQIVSKQPLSKATPQSVDSSTASQ